MLMKPSDLPVVDKAPVDPALRKVTEWKLENTEEAVPHSAAVAFVEEHMGTFFESMRSAFRLIEHKRPPAPTI